MFFWVTAAIVTVTGAVLGAWAWRGKRVDDHPVCRRCGFDLVGHREPRGACPECGADVSGPRGVRIGNRRRRRGALAAAGVLAGLGLTAGGGGAAMWAMGYDWYRVKPYGWLLSDAVSHAGTMNEPNVAELGRRLAAGGLSTSQTNRLVTAGLDVQGDRSLVLTDEWEAVLDGLMAGGAFGPAEWERYYEQGLTWELEVRPVIRRGQSLRINLRSTFDRLTDTTRVTGKREAEALTLGGVRVHPAGWFEGRTHGQSASGLGSNYSLATDVKWRQLKSAPDGPTALETAIIYELTPVLTTTAPTPTVTVRVPISTQLRIAAADAVVDRFVAEEGHRDAMEAAWTRTRVEVADGKPAVWLRLESPPVAMAMGVWLRWADEEARVGGLLVEAGSSPRWRKIGPWRPPRGPAWPTEGEAEVVLKPEQSAADYVFALDTYWADPMRRDGVMVNEPYEPAFNRDASLTEQMEKAVTIKRVSVRDPERKKFGMSLSTWQAPVRLAYKVVLLHEGREIPGPSHITLSAKAGDNMSYSSGGYPIPDPAMDRIDILLVPDREWEDGSTDPTPPWGYPLLFEDVPLPATGAGPAAGPFHGKALIEDED